MILYSLTNQYCPDIHAGIQCQHSTVEMFMKYNSIDSPEMTSIIHKWALEHKTTVLLNAGDHNKLQHILDYYLEYQESIPFAYFKEPGLNFTYTSISLICTEKMVHDMSMHRKNDLLYDFEYFTATYGYVLANLLILISKMRTI